MAPQRGDDEEGRAAQANSWASVNYLLRSGKSWSGGERNNAYLNLGDGTFADISYPSGLGFVDDARGAAPLDWDGDGDLDLWLNTRSSPKIRFMRNDDPGANHHVAFRLEGRTCNRDAIGARVEVHLPDDRTIIKTVRAGVNYTVQGTKWVHFGLGEETRITGMTVSWPDGTRTEHRGVRADARYVITQGEQAPRALPPADAPVALEPASFSVPAAPSTAAVALGTPLPLPADLGLTDFDGTRHELRALRGQPVLINLWASWCSGCLKEFAHFAEHRDELERSGLKILACSVDKPEDLEAAIATPGKYDLWFPAGMVDPSMMHLIDVIKKVVLDRYEDLPLPTSLLVDPRGRLVRIYRGPAEATDIIDDVEQLLEAGSDLDVLHLTSPYPGGYWSRPDIFIASSAGNRLVGMTQFLTTEGRFDLLGYYARSLGAYMTERARPAGARRKATIALHKAGRALIEKRPEDSAEIYRALSRVDPVDVDARFGLASALIQIGDSANRSEAAAAFAAGIAEAGPPRDEERATTYGRMLYALGEFDEAVSYLEQAIEFSGAPNPGLEFRLANALDRAGRSEEAMARYERCVTITDPDDPAFEVRSRRGAALARLRRWPEAIATLQPLVDEAPERAADQALLGMALTYTADGANARKHLEIAVAALPDDAQSRYFLGLARAQTGDLPGAAAAFEEAVALRPTYEEAWLMLARAERQQGRASGAVGVFRRMQAAIPSSSAAAYNLAWSLATTTSDADRNGAEAMRIADQLVQAGGGANPRVLDLVAAAAADMGDFAQAVTKAKQAINAARTMNRMDLVSKIEARLALYERGQPYRE